MYQLIKSFFKRKLDLESDTLILKCIYQTKQSDYDYWLPSYVYDIIRKSDHKVVGRCDLRIGMNEYMYYMGNIGYVIYPPYRGHRYAAMSVLLMFDFAKKFMDEVIITCNPDNIASNKTCEIVGCTLKETVDVPKDHELVRQGDLKKNIYVRKLGSNVD